MMATARGQNTVVSAGGQKVMYEMKPPQAVSSHTETMVALSPDTILETIETHQTGTIYIDEAALVSAAVDNTPSVVDDCIYECSQCGKSFPTMAKVTKHMAVHDGDRPQPHACTYCDKLFSQLGNLKLHLLTHTREKPHECTMCGRCFSGLSNLKRHTRTHTGEKPYVCSHCGKGFSQSGQLKYHKAKFHPNLPQQVRPIAQKCYVPPNTHLCTVCDKAFERPVLLKQHMLTHTGQKPHLCLDCGQGSCNLSQLQRHMKTHTKQTCMETHPAEHCTAVQVKERQIPTIPEAEYTVELNLEAERSMPSANSSHAIIESKNHLTRVDINSRVTNVDTSEDAEDYPIYSDGDEEIPAHDTDILGSGYPMQLADFKGDVLLCVECGIRFDSKASWSAHRLCSHNQTQTYDCRDTCSNPPSETLRKHKQPSVSSASIGNDTKPRHKTQTVYEQGEPEVQSECGKDSDEDLHLFSKQKQNGPYPCLECDDTFSSKINLRVHSVFHRQDKPHVYPDCGVECETVNNLNIHMINHREENPAVCKECGAMFDTEDGLRKHMMAPHSLPKRYTFSAFGETFTRVYLGNEEGVQRHLLELQRENGITLDNTAISALEKGHLCKDCGRTFSKLHQLTNHRHKHKGITYRFICSICGKRFSSKFKLKEHTLVHLKRYIWVCSFCKHRFKMKSQLILHLRNHPEKLQTLSTVVRSEAATELTSVEMFECNVCKQRFFDERELAPHMGTHEGKPVDQQTTEAHSALMNYVLDFEAGNVENENSFGVYEDGANLPVANIEEVCVSQPESEMPRKQCFESSAMAATEKKESANDYEVLPVVEIASHDQTLIVEKNSAVQQLANTSPAIATTGENITGEKVAEFVSRLFTQGMVVASKKDEPISSTAVPTVRMSTTDSTIEASISGKDFPDTQGIDSVSASSNDVHERNLDTQAHTADHTYTLIDPECVDTSSKVDDCNKTTVTSSSYLDEHTNTAPKPNKTHKCSQCKKTFAEVSELRIHKNEHKGSYRHICAGCGKSFEYKHRLKEHVQLHVKKPHVCPHCKRSFKTKMALKAHVVVHADRINYSCPICDAPFNTLSDLKGHVIVHSNEQDPSPSDNPDQDDNDEPLDSDENNEIEEPFELVQQMASDPHHIDHRGEEERQENTLKVDNTHYTGGKSSTSSTGKIVRAESEIKERNVPETDDSQQEPMAMISQTKRRWRAIKPKLANIDPSFQTMQDGVLEPPSIILTKELLSQYNIDQVLLPQVTQIEQVSQDQVQGISQVPQRQQELSQLCEDQVLQVSNIIDVETEKQSTQSQQDQIPEKPIHTEEQLLRFEQDKVLSIGNVEPAHGCAFCTNRYSTRRNLERHMKTHSEYKPHECTYCEKRFHSYSNWKTHTMRHTGEKRHTCSDCGKGFITLQDLKSHSAAQHGAEAPHICLECGKGFASAVGLKYHMVKHMALKPFVCSDCGKGFVRLSCLKEHELLHTGEKPRVCPECGKCFRHKNHMEKHRMSHTIEGYRCVECGKRYSHRESMNAHMRTHTGETPFSCQYCDERFSMSYLRKKHVMTYHKDQCLVCVECGKQFSTHSALDAHMKVHPAVQHTAAQVEDRQTLPSPVAECTVESGHEPPVVSADLPHGTSVDNTIIIE